MNVSEWGFGKLSCKVYLDNDIYIKVKFESSNFSVVSVIMD